MRLYVHVFCDFFNFCGCILWILYVIFNDQLRDNLIYRVFVVYSVSTEGTIKTCMQKKDTAAYIVTKDKSGARWVSMNNTLFYQSLLV